MSRKCVPYTPLQAQPAELTIALVSSTAVYLEGQEPFGDDSDNSFRIIPGEADPKTLRFKHGHFDETFARQDPNCVFPLGLLQELAAAGEIRGVGNKHIGFRGYSTNLRGMYEATAPKIADEVERSKADAVILTGGCPACHRVIVAVQREIESRGLPTVLITVAPAESKTMRPPRAIAPAGLRPGRSLGEPRDKAGQLKVLRAALAEFTALRMPGEVRELAL